MTCRHCNHDREAHTHYRRGSDCATCSCNHFRGTRAAVAVVTRLRHSSAPAAGKLAA